MQWLPLVHRATLMTLGALSSLVSQNIDDVKGPSHVRRDRVLRNDNS